MTSTLETYSRNKPFIAFTGTTPGNPLVGARDIVSNRKLEVLWAGSTLNMADQFHDGEIRKLKITLQNPLIIEDESRESIYGTKGNARIVDEVLFDVRIGKSDWDGVIFLDTVDGMEVADVMAVFPKNASVDHAVQVTGTLTYDSDTGAPTVTHGFYDPELSVATASPSVKSGNADDEHGQALEETGFWGRAGAGSIVMAKETGRLLLPLRSDEVLEPGTWGTWGGAIDPNEDPQSAARRELQEEAGFTGELELVPLLVFKATDSGGQVTFRYHNFLAIVDSEFEPKLNWEAAEFRWVEPAKLPRPLHPGLQALFDDHASVDIIQAARAKAATGKGVQAPVAPVRRGPRR